MKKESKKQEFSKTLLIWETILIWTITLSVIALVYFCIINQYIGELAWLATMYAFPWAAYAVSQACYYKKAEKENTKGGIKYDSVMKAAEQVLSPEMIEKI
jgi:hypothetical protein